MNFLIFLWNLFARLVWFLSFIILEIVVFNIIVKAVAESNTLLAFILTVIFIIWILAEIFIRIFINGGKSILKWIFRF